MPASVFQRTAALVRGARNRLGQIAEGSARLRAVRDAMPERAASSWGWYIANEMRTGGWRGGLAATRRYFAGAANIPGQTFLVGEPTSHALRVRRRAGAVGAMMGAALLINPGENEERRRRQELERIRRYYY